FGNTPKYRIGIWRVLVQAASSEQERRKWKNKIAEVYVDTTSPDRLHAIETLAKLKYPVPMISSGRIKQMKDPITDPFTIYQLWNAAYRPEVGGDSVRKTGVLLLASDKQREYPHLIPVISYVLRYLKPFQVADWNALKAVALGFQGDDAIVANLLATAWLTIPDSAIGELPQIKNRLAVFFDDRKYLLQVFNAFAEKGGSDELNRLITMYSDLSDKNLKGYDADVHATAAYAVLKMMGRLEKNQADD